MRRPPTISNDAEAMLWQCTRSLAHSAASFKNINDTLDPGQETFVLQAQMLDRVRNTLLTVVSYPGIRIPHETRKKLLQAFHGVNFYLQTDHLTFFLPDIEKVSQLEPLITEAARTLPHSDLLAVESSGDDSDSRHSPGTIEGLERMQAR